MWYCKRISTLRDTQDCGMNTQGTRTSPLRRATVSRQDTAVKNWPPRAGSAWSTLKLIKKQEIFRLSRDMLNVMVLNAPSISFGMRRMVTTELSPPTTRTTQSYTLAATCSAFTKWSLLGFSAKLWTCLFQFLRTLSTSLRQECLATIRMSCAAQSKGQSVDIFQMMRSRRDISLLPKTSTKAIRARCLSVYYD